MSTVTDLQEAARILAAVAKLKLPAGALTDDEQLAIDVAVGLVAAAETFGKGHDDTADAVLGLLTQVPQMAAMVAGALATLRETRVVVDALEVEIGPLGPGVEVEVS